MLSRVDNHCSGLHTRLLLRGLSLGGVHIMSDDWTLRLEQTRKGELYREKERLKQEKEDTDYRRRNEDYEREQEEFRAENRRRTERENQTERQMHLHDLIQARDEDIEHLKLCRKFDIEEVE